MTDPSCSNKANFHDLNRSTPVITYWSYRQTALHGIFWTVVLRVSCVSQGVDSMAHYEQALRQVRYRNWKPASLSERKFRLTCSELNGRYTSNEFNLEVSLVSLVCHFFTLYHSLLFMSCSVYLVSVIRLLFLLIFPMLLFFPPSFCDCTNCHLPSIS